MPRTSRIQFPGAFYHVLSRGIERRPIYHGNRERERFLEFLRDSQEKFQIRIFAYCLMDNHYHLLVQTKEANLSQTMKYLNGSYATYINAKRKRVGHVFAYKYKSIVVENDTYLMTLSRYIHLNPVKAGIVAMPVEYKWSSYRAYLGMLQEPWLDSEWVLKIFSSEKQSAMKRYRQFVEQGLDEKMGDPFKEVFRGAVLGSREFIEKVIEGKQEWEDKNRENKKDQSTIDQIIELIDRSNNWDIKTKRKLAVYLSRQCTNETYEEIGKRFEMKSRQAVENMVKRFSLEMEKNKILADEVLQLKSWFKK